MEQLHGAKEIAAFLGISERWFYKIKARCQGTRWQCPALIYGVGCGRYRKRIMWTTRELAYRWWYHVLNAGIIRHKNARRKRQSVITEL